MTVKPVTNLSASVRQRLLDISRKEKREFAEVLTRFALERLLYRLSISSDADSFVLKGALLFVLWTEEIHRFTQDMDLLGRGDPSPEHLTTVFRAVCVADVQPDGLVFDADSITARPIREDNTYSGVRIKLRAMLERARIPLQIDVGFGDSTVPEPEEVDFPPLLSFPAPHLRVYRKETSIAEKFSAMVTLGIDNSRMKDYFDIWLLSQRFEFDGATLTQAIRSTFARRNEPLPQTVPVGVSEAFSSSASKQTQWQAFVRQRVVAPDTLPPFSELIIQVRAFLLPILEAARQEDADGYTIMKKHWSPGGIWKDTTEDTNS